jgi:hypothetical protein
MLAIVRWGRHARRCESCTSIFNAPHSPITMDPASQALAEALAVDVSISYRALADRKNVPRSTLHRRKHGGSSKESKARLQQYLTPEEEKAIVRFLLLVSNLGHPVRIEFIPLLAFNMARRRSTAVNAIKPPGKNWPRAFKRRHKELKAKKVKVIDCRYHENNIYRKMTE